MADGIDPAEARQAEKAAAKARRAAEQEAIEAERRRREDRVDVLLDQYMRQHVDALRTAREVRRLFDREVRPAWGTRPVADITRKDVVQLIERIADRGAGTVANRVLANLRPWFSWCCKRGVIDTSPAERVDPPTRETARDRVLTDDEVRRLVLALDGMAWPWRHFFTVALLTGQRREEVAGMRWDELDGLDGDAPTWVLPKERTKNKREHAVPLAPAVVEVIRSAPRLPNSPFVFTTTGQTSIAGFSKAKAALDAAMSAKADDTNPGAPKAATAASWRLHDLRRTAASGMARHGIQVAVVEKVLNHVSGTFGGIVGVYQRFDFAAEKRHALEAVMHLS